jgi:hypothetical protein
LLKRVAASSVFQKSNRLRQLLLYLGERGLEDPDSHIRESDIGVEVFGRGAGYDTSQDTLVRVQASHLRKKLKEYFDGEGREEQVIVDLPKGIYTLAFQERGETADVDLAPEPTQGVTRRTWLPWALAAVLLAIAIALVTDNVRLRHRANPTVQASPEVSAFWRQILNSGHNYVVMSDANLVVFENMIGRDIPIQDYQNRSFDLLANRYIEDAELRSLTLNVVTRLYTGLADARVARKISSICAANGIDTSVVIAREISATQVAGRNTVLFGSRRANPWITLFEDRLNFRTVFEESPRGAWFTNLNPKPGEEREYRGVFGRTCYCRVAFLSNPKGTGNTLLISGTDVPATDAGGDFVTSESWVGTLRNALKLRATEPYPHFEALLSGQLVNNSVPQFELIAIRRY